MSDDSAALEQSLLRAHRRLRPPPRRVLMAISGGLDSMVMAELLHKWRRGLRLELAVAHVHHGPAPSSDQAAYRDRARHFVQQWAVARDLKFFTNSEGPTEKLESEQAWRDWRERWIKKWVREGDFEAVAMAHHMDDLLETRLIRLVRGSGAQGLRAMSELRHGKWRPLLAHSRVELEHYARARQLSWLEDPSNKKTRFLRNWMRREWLPQLEVQRPGALKTLARSLENLAPVEGLSELESEDWLPFVGLRRAPLAQLTVTNQRELVARYLRSLGLKGYQSSHVDEILKRMDGRRETFAMLGVKFHLSPDLLWASRV